MQLRPRLRILADRRPMILKISDSKGFSNPVHCVHISIDELVYVCDRTNDRIQIFTKQGRFVKEFLIHPGTMGIGSVWTINFSRDVKQKYLSTVCGTNNVIWIWRGMTAKRFRALACFGQEITGQFH